MPLTQQHAKNPRRGLERPLPEDLFSDGTTASPILCRRACSAKTHCRNLYSTAKTTASHGHCRRLEQTTRQSPESAASTRSRAMKALTGSPTSTTKRPATASHGPNALVWKRQPCAFRKCKLVHRKLCCIKFRTSQRLPEPSEDSLQMLGTQREKTSTVKARLTTLSRMVAIAPMAKRNDIVRGLYSAAPSVAHRSSGLEPIILRG